MTCRSTARANIARGVCKHVAPLEKKVNCRDCEQLGHCWREKLSDVGLDINQKDVKRRNAEIFIKAITKARQKLLVEEMVLN